MDGDRRSGIPAVGALAPGSHFCQFYRTREDLLDCLIPFLKAGLEQHERCICVASEPVSPDAAREALLAATPDLDGRALEEHVEFLDAEGFRRRAARGHSADMVGYWLEAEQEALARGFRGLRVTGNASWLEREDWADFMAYEASVNQRFAHRKIVGMCSYQLQRCQSEDVIDVVRNHRFALARRAGAWELLEASSLLTAKEELRQANANLERRVEERTAELRTALQARDDFLSVASHELKTPVAALELYLEALVRRAGRDEPLAHDWLLEQVVRTRRQAERLVELVDELLDVSRASQGDLALELEWVDLAELARTAAERLAPQLAKAGCALTLQVAAPVRGFWDRARLERAVLNLLSNAAQHAAGGPVVVRVGERGGRGVLEVVDHGPGIPEGERRRIFERFVRVGPGRRPKGLGLGLWIVRQIARQHGGEVEVSGKAGEGAAFTLVLPKDASAEQARRGSATWPRAASCSSTTTPTSAKPSRTS